MLRLSFGVLLETVPCPQAVCNHAANRAGASPGPILAQGFGDCAPFALNHLACALDLAGLAGMRAGQR